MTTVTETLQLPGSVNPRAIVVHVFLAGEDGVPLPAGYATVAGETIVGEYQLNPDATGLWSVTLDGNADISPSGTVWGVKLSGPAAARVSTTARYLTVPTSGTAQVGDILVDPPGALDSAALAVETAARIAGDEDLTLNINQRVAKAGDTMTGPLTLSGPGTDPLNPVTKAQLDAVQAALVAADASLTASLAAYVPKAGVYATGTDTVLAARISGDSTDRRVLRADGSVGWTDGAGSTELTLSRTAANIMTLTASLALTGGSLQVTRTASTQALAVGRQTADVFDRITILTSGKLSWGDGTGAAETILERTAVNQLALTGALSLNRDLFLSATNGNAFIQMAEQSSPPAAPAANRLRLYSVDNGSGKTQLMCLFNTGAAQQVAIQP